MVAMMDVSLTTSKQVTPSKEILIVLILPEVLHSFNTINYGHMLLYFLSTASLLCRNFSEQWGFVNDRPSVTYFLTIFRRPLFGNIP